MIHSGRGLVFLLCLLPGTLALAQPAAEQKQVLLLLETPGVPAVNIYVDSLAASLRRMPVAVDLYTEVRDANRFAGAEQDAIVAKLLQDKYAGVSLDLVIAVGPGSLRFVTQRHESLFGDVPVIFAGVDEANPGLAKLPANTTGIASKFDATGTLELAMALQPDATMLVVVSGAAPLDRSWHARTRDLVSNYESRMDVRYLAGEPMDSLLAELGDLPGNAIVLLLTVMEDGTGKRLIPALESAPLITGASNAPVYGVYETYIGHGVVGGHVGSFAALGVETAQLAQRILGGENASQIPVRRATSEYVVDWREMRRWNLDEALLPPGTGVRFREPSLWIEYKWLVVTALVMLVFQAATIGALLVQRARRREAEAERRESELRFHAELAHLNRVGTMGEFAASMAHELSQPLSAIVGNAEVAAMLLERNPPDLGELRDIIGDVRDDNRRAVEIIQGMRRFLQRREVVMRPVDLNSLVEQVIHFANVQALARSLTLTFVSNPELPKVAGDRVHLQQVLMNLILNAMDAVDAVSGGPRTIAVAAREVEAQFVTVTVSDTGRGIPESQLESIFKPFYTTKEDGIGMGLPIIRSIIEAHHGRVWAQNNGAGGATFHFTLPACPGEGTTPDSVASEDCLKPAACAPD